MKRVFSGGPIFDGARLLQGWALAMEGARVTALTPAAEMRETGARVDLGGDILAPGFVDLQVNGGGGVMLGDAPEVDTLRRMAAAHRMLGATTILPTLISDSEATTRKTVDAVRAALAAGVPGVAGLHLEGPHLAPSRKGAHEARHLRPMGAADVAFLTRAAEDLPVLKVTLAPEAATAQQVAELTRAGVRVALGHTDADFETCRRYAAAGARMVTHLFNAMSPLSHRAPGVVGAALAEGRLSAGLIADGYHVHPEVMAMAFAAKRGPGEIYLVSDAMAVAGTGMAAFELGGREITRAKGCLRLADGTLAGADLALTGALEVLTRQAGLPLAAALRAATAVPARLIGLSAGRLTPGASADPIRIAGDLSRARPVLDRPMPA